MLSARIKNSSTNIVSIGVVFGPVYDFKVRLLDGAGQEHDAIPKAPVRMVNGNRLMDILPGQTIETAIPIHNLNPTLKPENYTLKATRDMIVRDSRSPRETRKWQVVSNLVKVRLE
jgi:hypothetical protein